MLVQGFPILSFQFLLFLFFFADFAMSPFILRRVPAPGIAFAKFHLGVSCLSAAIHLTARRSNQLPTRFRYTSI